MKKSLALLLVAALLLGVFALIGCNKPAGTDAQQLSVCLIVPYSFGDKSFNDSALEGAERLKEDYGIKLNTIECKNEGYKQNMMNAAEENDFVIPIGWEFSEIKSVWPRNIRIRSLSGSTMWLTALGKAARISCALPISRMKGHSLQATSLQECHRPMQSVQSEAMIRKL